MLIPNLKENNELWSLSSYPEFFNPIIYDPTWHKNAGFFSQKLYSLLKSYFCVDFDIVLNFEYIKTTKNSFENFLKISKKLFLSGVYFTPPPTHLWNRVKAGDFSNYVSYILS